MTFSRQQACVAQVSPIMRAELSLILVEELDAILSECASSTASWPVHAMR